VLVHAHFFVVDRFANTFILATFCLWSGDGQGNDRLRLLRAYTGNVGRARSTPLRWRSYNAGAGSIWRAEPDRRSAEFSRAIVQLAVAAVLSLLTFRVLQPYAFKGPSFFSFALNPNWLTNMREVAALTGGGVDAPFALQWAASLVVLRIGAVEMGSHWGCWPGVGGPGPSTA
jgi:hypothetical protein